MPPCGCKGGWGGLPGPGPEAWQVDESSILDLGWGDQAGVWERYSSWILVVVAVVVGAKGTLVFDEFVDVVLGSVLAGGDFKDESNDEQGLLGVPAGDHLGVG